MAAGTTKEHKSSGLTQEEEDSLAEINAGEGKNLTSGQKMVVMRFGTINIKGKPPDKSMSVDIPAGPKVVPKQRKLPTMEDK